MNAIKCMKWMLLIDVIMVQSGRSVWKLFGSTISLLLLSAGLVVQPVMADVLQRPDCARLEQWSAALNPEETFALAPGVELTSLLNDDRVIPLFGQAVEAWEGSHFSAIGGWLSECRVAASKRRDKVVARQLYVAMKAVRTASSTMQRAQRMHSSAAQKVQQIIRHPSAPGVAAVLELAQEALQGEDINARLRTLTPRVSITGYVSGLQQAYPYLSERMLAPLLAQLAQRKTEVDTEMGAVAEEMEAANRELAETAISQQGLTTLTRLAQLPVLEKVSRDEARAFQAAVQKRRMEIQSSLQQRQMQQAAALAAQPIDIVARLAQLLEGNTLQEVSMRGLRPGMKHPQAQSHLLHQWRFQNMASMDLNEKYRPPRQEWGQYLRDRRDGGRVEFDTVEDAVEQFRFIELYKGVLEPETARAWLVERFGKPDKEQSTSYGRVMAWSDSTARLQVEVVNQVDVFEQGSGFRSKLTVALWNRDFEQHMQARKQRCDTLRKMPRNQLSIDDTMFFARRCSL